MQPDPAFGRPRVSVVTIFLDAGRFLREAVESVFAQTYADWELLLVDDGSKDAGTTLARAYSSEHPARVRYLQHEGGVNRGMSASRNLGAREARGDLIAFLDADDVWLPGKLEQQVALLDAHPAASLVCGPTEDWFSWTGDPVDGPRDFVRSLGFDEPTVVHPPTLLRRVLESRVPTPAPSAICVRRAAFERVGGFEESFTGVLSLFEDQAFLSKVYLSETVVVGAECCARYRQHPDSCSAVVHRAGQKLVAGLHFLDWLGAYLAEQGVADPALWRGLDKKRWRYRHPVLDRAKRRIARSGRPRRAQPGLRTSHET